MEWTKNKSIFAVATAFHIILDGSLVGDQEGIHFLHEIQLYLLHLGHQEEEV